MAKPKRRRASSMRVETYWRLLELVRRGVGESGSAIVELKVNELADAHGVPKVSRMEAIARLPKRGGRPPGPVPKKSEEIVSQHFTF